MEASKTKSACTKQRWLKEKFPITTLWDKNEKYAREENTSGLDSMLCLEVKV